MTKNEEWNELDGAAKANLSKDGFEKFLKYKEELKKDGLDWDGDAEEILRGYIWDESEEIS